MDGSSCHAQIQPKKVILLPVGNFELGVFAYGVGVAAAPLPVRAHRLYTIADTPSPDLWFIRDVKKREELMVSTPVVDQGLHFIPWDMAETFETLLSGTAMEREIARLLIGRWARAPQPSIVDVYRTFLEQIRAATRP